MIACHEKIKANKQKKALVNEMKHQIIALPILILILLAITGFTYSRWIDTVNITGSVKMAHMKTKITSCKLLYPSKEFDDNNVIVSDDLSPDKTTLLIISENLYSGWYVWVGIVISNEETQELPVSITYTIINDNPTIWTTYFSHEEHFYGPYRTDLPKNVWAKVNLEPPPKDYVPPPPLEGESQPPDLDPGYKLIAWQLVKLDESYSGSPFTIQVLIGYTAIYEFWQKHLYVQFELAF